MIKFNYEKKLNSIYQVDSFYRTINKQEYEGNFKNFFFFCQAIMSH